MKNKYFLPLLLLSALLLTACSQKNETSQSSSDKQEVTNKTESSSSTISSNESQMTSSSSESSTLASVEEENTATSEVKRDAEYNGNYYSIQGKYGEVVIVNKKHPLSPSYAPGENPTARAAFLKLVGAMQSAGYDVSNNYSGFRSYDTQTGIYNSYVSRDGQANADRYSARPGYSEHQTGLAFDLMDSSGSLLEESSAVDWLAKNAHHYGFVVRYIAGKESITGYMPESWHIRYVGDEANDIYQSGLTLEEYYGVVGGNYE